MDGKFELEALTLTRDKEPLRAAMEAVLKIIVDGWILTLLSWN